MALPAITPEPAATHGPAGSGVSALSSEPARPRIRRMITTRRGGVSGAPYDSFNLGAAVGDDPAAVAANRARLAAAVGLSSERIVWMRQVHGATVIPVDESTGAPPTMSPGMSGSLTSGLPDTDGIATATPGLALAVLVADCVPILAADPVAGVVAAVHAGRRGAAGGIALRAMRQMTALGAAVEDIDVLLGPAICGSCYEVPGELRDEVEATLPGSAATTSAGTPGLDLRAGLARQLREVGIGAVVLDPRCTFTDPDLFSHRGSAPTGRFAGLIWMAP